MISIFTLSSRIVLLLTLALCIASPQLAGGTIYDAYAPGLHIQNSYSAGCVSPVCYFATPFVPSASGSLDRIIVPLGETDSSTLTFSLWTDTAGVPGTQIESWIAPVTTLNSVNFTFQSAAHPMLVEGATYWAVYSGTMDSGSSTIYWGYSTSAPAGGPWIGTSLSSLSNIFDTYPVLALEVDTTPEPSTILLSLAGLGALAYKLRRV